MIVKAMDLRYFKIQNNYATNQLKQWNKTI